VRIKARRSNPSSERLIPADRSFEPLAPRKYRFSRCFPCGAFWRYSCGLQGVYGSRRCQIGVNNSLAPHNALAAIVTSTCRQALRPGEVLALYRYACGRFSVDRGAERVADRQLQLSLGNQPATARSGHSRFRATGESAAAGLRFDPVVNPGTRAARRALLPGLSRAALAAARWSTRLPRVCRAVSPAVP
jgi:hypothetical protein